MQGNSNIKFRNECFLWGKCSWQPYHLHVTIVLKCGNLNLLETSGPVQACNGITFAPHTINDKATGTYAYHSELNV